ncbi:MAG: 2-oxo acid dehydrogenase subunit E2 [Nevskiaceae bacterium]|nr:MAG: 2-oxo acid dehydrogenase subunit E2 [Nevskiaceae bacterium]TBR73663.1 MAG: 2-oxo acid dehydrogenase subunit E2 [Nevskiaceae bacterium]
MSAFKLPDLGEGLAEAEIREWLVENGDTVAADQPLLSVETDKAVVEIPSPRAGRILKRHGKVGDIVAVGAVLVEFAGGKAAPTTGAVSPPRPPQKVPGKASPSPSAAPLRDSGVIVGATTRSDEIRKEAASRVGTAAGVRATPAVRALAHKLDVDLTVVTPSGPGGVVTAADVQRVHRVLAAVGPLQALHGPRRAMAHTMSQARDEVMPCTLMDDAVLAAWRGEQDVTLRLIHAIVAACRAEPALNAWYDPTAIGRRVLKAIDLGVAVDTAEGLFVCLLADVGARDDASLRTGLERMKADAANRTVALENLRGYSITLSNYGRFGGRYATPVVVPPTVAIVAAGAVRETVVAVDHAPAVARVLPLSLTFDHRCVTGSEAARFMSAMIAELQRPFFGGARQ